MLPDNVMQAASLRPACDGIGSMYPNEELDHGCNRDSAVVTPLLVSVQDYLLHLKVRLDVVPFLFTRHE